MQQAGIINPHADYYQEEETYVGEMQYLSFQCWVRN